MAKPDMSAKAVTARLIRTGQLRKLCLELAKKPERTDRRTPPPPPK